MARVIPLIRAAALMPVLHWLRENGRSAAEVVTEAGQGYLLSAAPHTAIPILGAVSVISVLERREGPDFGLRCVTEAGLRELSVVSRSVLGARTPREAFARVVTAMPHHCTHEVFSVLNGSDGLTVRDTLAVPMDQRTRHAVDLYILAIVREICAMTGASGPLLLRVELTPHPDLGLSHLVPWFGEGVSPSRGRMLTARIGAAVADRPFRRVARDRFATSPPLDGSPLRGDGSLAYSVRTLLPLLMDDGNPTLDGLVALSGMSRRTLQRRLAEEGTSFSDLFEGMRQGEAMRRLMTGESPIAEVSRQLGFSQQSALTRAMRRWTGEVPSRLRSRGTS
jgi:AraC-like DNA-binding protein